MSEIDNKLPSVPKKNKEDKYVKNITERYFYRRYVEGNTLFPKHYYCVVVDRDSYTNDKAVEVWGVKKHKELGWIEDDKNKRMKGSRIPYNLDIIQKSEDKDIFWVEGEKDVDNLRAKAGVVATTSSGGAGNFNSTWESRDYWAKEFEGKRIIIIGDEDKAGKKYVAELMDKLNSLQGVTAIAPAFPLDMDEDISDWLNKQVNQVDTKEKIYDIINNAPIPDGYFTGSEYEEAIPEAEHSDVVVGLLPVGVVMCNAIMRVGKTQLLLTLSKHITEGTEWSGMKVNQGEVLYHALEGQREDYLERRKTLGLDTNKSFHFFPPEKYVGMTPEDLMKKIIEMLRLRPDIRLVVIDTLANYNPKLISENRNDFVTQSMTMNMFTNLAKAYGICIVLTHHSSAKNPNQSVEASGLYSNSLNNLSHNIISLTSDNAGERIIETKPKREEHLIYKTQLLQHEQDGGVYLGKTVLEEEEENIEEMIFNYVELNGSTKKNELPKLLKKNRQKVLNITNEMLRNGRLMGDEYVEVPSSDTSQRTQNPTPATTIISHSSERMENNDDYSEVSESWGSI